MSRRLRAITFYVVLLMLEILLVAEPLSFKCVRSNRLLHAYSVQQSDPSPQHEAEYQSLRSEVYFWRDLTDHICIAAAILLPCVMLTREFCRRRKRA